MNLVMFALSPTENYKKEETLYREEEQGKLKTGMKKLH